MFLASAGLCLVAYTSLNSMFSTLIAIGASQVVLYMSIHHYLSAEITVIITSSLNLLACVLMPLDQLDKLLETRDVSYCSYLMNFLNLVSCLIWGLYHTEIGNTALAFSNYAGVIASIALVPGCLYATKTMEKSNPIVSLSNLFINLCYRCPSKLIPTSSSDKVHIDKDSVTSSAKDVLTSKGTKSTKGTKASSGYASSSVKGSAVSGLESKKN